MSNVIVEHRNRPNMLTAKSIKATIVLSPAEVAEIPTPEDKPRFSVRIAAGGRIVTAELNAKSVRRAIAAIREAGPDNVAVILQGKLEANNSLAEAGLAVQPKTRPQNHHPPSKVRREEMPQLAPSKPTRSRLLLQVLSRLSQASRSRPVLGEEAAGNGV